MDNCSRGVISIFCRAKCFVYCCDVCTISFGLARFAVSKTQNSVKERVSMVQNFFSVEDGSLIFNLIKSILLMVVRCLQFFVAWEAILKLTVVLKNLALGDSVGSSQFHLFSDPKNLRT